MLVKLAPDEVKLGMFVHSFEGSWADRPFWQTRFVLEDHADLARLRKSAVAAVVIDTALGRKPPRQPSPRRPRSAAPPPRDPDRRRARKTIDRSRQMVCEMMADVREGRAIAAERLVPIVAELGAEVERNAAVVLEMLRLKTKDEYTYLHSVAVSALMMNLARALGLDAATVSDFGLAGLLHDVGKIGIADAILNKPGALTATEFAAVRQHPDIGHAFLLGAAGLPPTALDVCLHHHERVDGAGYPSGLEGEGISLAARMGAICDVYDALTSDRAYKAAWTPHKALGEMQGWRGQFDPDLLETFMVSLGFYPIGCLVSVRDAFLGIVTDASGPDSTRLSVRWFYSIPRRARLRCEDSVVADSAILAPQRPQQWGLEDWPNLRRELLVGGTPR